MTNAELAPTQYVTHHLDGCGIRLVCLTCDLPACVFDDSRMLYWDQVLEVRQRRSKGETAPGIADALGIRVRQVWRRLAIYKEMTQ